MTLLHFDYFRKHEEFVPESNPPQDEAIKKNDFVENDKKNDKNEVFWERYKKKAS